MMKNDTVQHHWSIKTLCNTVDTPPVRGKSIPALLVGVAAQEFAQISAILRLPKNHTAVLFQLTVIYDLILEL